MPERTLGGICRHMLLIAITMATVVAVDLDYALPGAIEVGSRISFNADWRFARFGKQYDGSTIAEPDGLSAPGFDDGAWRRLDLPHDWGIEGPFNIDLPGETGKLPWFGIGWYRKAFTVPAADQGQRIFLDFDGAMSDSTVYVNGDVVGGWPNGYSSWRVELTGKVKFGATNTVAVRLDNQPDSSRWYPGGGIYRNTWLVTVDPVHVAHWGVYVTTPQVRADEAKVRVQVSVDNQGDTAADTQVTVDIWRLGTTPTKVAFAKAGIERIDGGGNAIYNLDATVVGPALWDVDAPNLHCALTTVSIGGKAVDTQRTVFGIRSIQITADRGVLVNGKRVPIRGVCNHHDLGALGAAVNTRALERQLEIMKEMGCNSIRTSHNPPAPELLDFCDRMGLLVMVEAFDCWASRKKPNDYARFFKNWHLKDVTALVRRDRNHPSVFLWSAGNEVPEQGQGEKGLTILRDLTAIFHREDPTRLVTVGCNHGSVVKNGFYKGTDVLGLNYKPHLYEEFHKKEPAIPVHGSETASCVSSRGEYFFPMSDDKAKGLSNFQVSSYDLYAPNWAMAPDLEFAAQDKTSPYNLGEYVWTGFDYLGEPTPFNNDPTNLLNFHDETSRKAAEEELKQLGKIKSPSRSSYFGIVDLCGFKKDRFYLYQAKWRPELPMVHILPHWTWPERVGQVTPIHVYTSGDEVELFLNGASLGRKKKGESEYRLRWDDVKYEPGTVKAMAYKAGKSWAEVTVATTNDATKLLASADRACITADGKDLSFVTITIADEQGRLVPRSKNLVRFTVEGPGAIVAVDNGDATSLEPFIAKQMKAYNGLCLAIVKATGPGRIILRAESTGLTAANLALTAQ
jgi:beta-galactosidase